MRRIRQCTPVFLVLIIVCSFIPCPASADLTPGPYIQFIAQKDQDIEFEIEIVDWIKPLTLLGKNINKEWVVFENRDLSEEEPDDTGPYCKIWSIDGGEEEICRQNPDNEDCSDCDGDGINECYGDCMDWYLFTVKDHDVTPGETTYELWEEDYFSDEITVHVKDNHNCSYSAMKSGSDYLCLLDLFLILLPGLFV